MTWLGQGHSKWVNLSLKHITATRHTDIPRGEEKKERERNTVRVRRSAGENYKKERDKDNERNLKAIPFIMRMTL